jgi:hypothetical protein
MKQTVNFSNFNNAFEAIRPDNFTYYGREVLFDYIEGLEFSTGEEFELDVIAFCCDFTENCAYDIAQDYAYEIDPNWNEDEIAEEVRNRLENATIICGDYKKDGKTYFVYQNY